MTMTKDEQGISLTVKLDSRAEETAEKIAAVNEAIAHTGVSLLLNKVGNDAYLTVAVDQQKLKENKTRFAGRRKGTYSTKANWKIKSISVQEILTLREQGMKHEEIIEMIGCPRASYYRAWKRVKSDPEIDLDGNFFNFLNSKRNKKEKR